MENKGKIGSDTLITLLYKWGPKKFWVIPSFVEVDFNFVNLNQFLLYFIFCLIFLYVYFVIYMYFDLSFGIFVQFILIVVEYWNEDEGRK